jgi:Tfp pilus assembly major pilin PilA
MNFVATQILSNILPKQKLLSSVHRMHRGGQKTEPAYQNLVVQGVSQPAQVAAAPMFITPVKPTVNSKILMASGNSRGIQSQTVTKLKPDTSFKHHRPGSETTPERSTTVKFMSKADNLYAVQTNPSLTHKAESLVPHDRSKKVTKLMTP